MGQVSRTEWGKRTNRAQSGGTSRSRSVLNNHIILPYIRKNYMISEEVAF
jgi:hypothetical protein